MDDCRYYLSALLLRGFGSCTVPAMGRRHRFLMVDASSGASETDQHRRRCGTSTHIPVTRHALQVGFALTFESVTKKRVGISKAARKLKLGYASGFGDNLMKRGDVRGRQWAWANT